MRLGFAVKVLGAGGLPSHDARRWQSGPHLRVSIENLRAIVDYLDDHDIRFYRIVTDFVPYGTHPGLPQFHDQIAECARGAGGDRGAIRERGVRVSTHPGQYIVLNSEKAETQAAAVRDLDLQGELFDALGMGPESVVVTHVGRRRRRP